MPYTLTAPCEYFEEIKRSRFLALAAPIDSAEQAMAFLAERADGTASHNCWAWKLGPRYRFNDDGEPGGSAGRPILSAIENLDFDGLALLVIRWFGGQKLGTGGLARAYGGCAAKCIQNGPKTLLIPRQRVHCRCDYPDLAFFKARLAGLEAQLLEENFDADGAHMHLSVASGRVPELECLLRDLSRGRRGLIKLD